MLDIRRPDSSGAEASTGGGDGDGDGRVSYEAFCR
jgi:hypothetical protein